MRLTASLAEKWSTIEQDLASVEVKDVLIHRIRAGETLSSIAARYRVDSKRIMSLNPGLRSSRLKVGTEVAVPTSMIIQKARSTKKKAATRYRVQG